MKLIEREIKRKVFSQNVVEIHQVLVAGQHGLKQVYQQQRIQFVCCIKIEIEILSTHCWCIQSRTPNAKPGSTNV